jgi:hypothetical protein
LIRIHKENGTAAADVPPMERWNAFEGQLRARHSAQNVQGLSIARSLSVLGMRDTNLIRSAPPR